MLKVHSGRYLSKQYWFCQCYAGDGLGHMCLWTKKKQAGFVLLSMILKSRNWDAHFSAEFLKDFNQHAIRLCHVTGTDATQRVGMTRSDFIQSDFFLFFIVC